MVYFPVEVFIVDLTTCCFILYHIPKLAYTILTRQREERILMETCLHSLLCVYYSLLVYYGTLIDNRPLVINNGIVAGLSFIELLVMICIASSVQPIPKIAGEFTEIVVTGDGGDDGRDEV